MAKSIKVKLKLPIILLLILVALLTIAYHVIFSDKFFPGSYIGDTNISFLTKPEAIQVLSAKFDKRSKDTLEYLYLDKHFQIDLSTIQITTQIIPAIDKAFSQRKNISPEINFSNTEQLEIISQTIHDSPRNAVLKTSLEILPGKDGQDLDMEVLTTQLKNYIIFGSPREAGKIPKGLPIKKVTPKITTEKAEKTKAYLENLNNNPIKLLYNDNSWTLDTNTLFPLLDLSQTDNQFLDKGSILNYLTKVVSLDQPRREAQFNFDASTGKVSVFQPAQEGRELDTLKTAGLIELALKNERPKVITLPVNITEPKIKTEEVNNLGIKELLGRGISNFAGSIPNRIYNVALTASKINGVLVPPGEIFSFNQTVGDITAATGFKKAYVIKEGRTVLDDGGGVCQDSTTLFRAVLNAGLPVVKRTAHTYRVGYYEQGFPPGLDATVFYPTVDFQFKNDTGHHILIQAHTEGLTLFVDLYGTSDGRTVTLSKPIVTNQTPAPPELRQDDPTLPKGVVKQVDFAASGADVSFKRTIIKAGQTITNEWKSSYRPWQAIFLVGTQ